MASNIYKILFKQKLDNFICTFSTDSTSLFSSLSGRLIHPGEYGMYRERCLKDILSYFLDKNYTISDGFIINSNNEVSTQCDVIIHNSKIMPLIDNNISNFFPMEVISSIGEVKSTLSKDQLKETLRKLAKNKMLFSNRISTSQNQRLIIMDEVLPLSFLVCKKIDCNLN